MLLHDFYAFRCMNLRTYRSVLLTFMTHFDFSERSRECPFHPIQIAQMRSNTNNLHTRFYDLYAQHILAQPRSRSRSPAMTQAMSESFITISSKITMNVLLTRRNQFIYRCGTRKPIQVKILPKCSRSHIQHTSPIATNNIQGTLIISPFS